MDHTVIFLWVLLLSATASTVSGATPMPMHLSATVPSRCGETFSDVTGSFEGPYYLGEGNVQKCLWRINSPDRRPIRLTVSYINLDCATEYIAIYDGDAHSSTLLGRVCRGIQKTFFSYSGTITVVLYRKSYTEGQGFVAFYDVGEMFRNPWPTADVTIATPTPHSEKLPAPFTPEETVAPRVTETLPTPPESEVPPAPFTPEETVAPRVTETLPTPFTPEETVAPRVTETLPTNQCGGNLSDSYGSISGPYYAGNHINVQCVWEIQVRPYESIILQFSSINLDCDTEYIEIFDGPQYSPYPLGKTCSGIYLNYTYSSTSNTMTIVMHRDSGYSGNGFSAHYYSVTQEPSRLTTTPASLTTTPASTTNYTRVSCSEGHMRAWISIYYLNSVGYNATQVYLNTLDRSCSSQIIGGYVYFAIPFYGCNTERRVKYNDTIVYYNVIKTFNSDHVIIRERNFQFHVLCEMKQNTVVQTKFIVQNAIDITQNQTGHYNVSLAFYSSLSFANKITESTYYVSLNQNLYLQATLHSTDPNLVLFLDTCIASPDSNDFTTLTYDLIRSGCARDSTYRNLHSPRKNVVRFQFNSFKFLNKHNTVYIQCKLVVCRANDRSSRCYQGCLIRKKRDTDELQEKVNVIVGPLKLQKDVNGVQK